MEKQNTEKEDTVKQSRHLLTAKVTSACVCVAFLKVVTDEIACGDGGKLFHR